MSKALVSISHASLRQQPFFVIEGPDGERLPCQWTTFGQGHAAGCEFENLSPADGSRSGRLFGLYEDGEFRMRSSYEPYPGMSPIPVDMDWRGDLNCVTDSGHDWCMGEHGIEICDHAEDEDLIALANAA